MAQDLNGIVQRMLDAGESEENIASVIQSFSPAPSGQPVGADEPGTFLGGFTKHLLSKEPATLGALGGAAALAAPLVGAGAGVAGALGAAAPAAGHLLTRGYRALTGQTQEPVGAGEVADVFAGPALQYGSKGLAAVGGYIARHPGVQKATGAILGGIAGHKTLPGIGAFGGALIGEHLGEAVVKPLAQSAAKTRTPTQVIGALRSSGGNRFADDAARSLEVPGYSPRTAQAAPAAPQSLAEGAGPMFTAAEGPFEVPLAGTRRGALSIASDAPHPLLDKGFGGRAEVLQQLDAAPTIPVNKSRAPKNVQGLTANDLEALGLNPALLKGTKVKSTPEIIARLTAARTKRSGGYKLDAEILKELKRQMQD